MVIIKGLYLVFKTHACQEHNHLSNNKQYEQLIINTHNNFNIESYKFLNTKEVVVAYKEESRILCWCTINELNKYYGKYRS